MPDMQIAVRLGRKAGNGLADASGLEIGIDDVADEIAPGLRRACAARFFVHRHASSTLISAAPSIRPRRAWHDAPFASLSTVPTHCAPPSNPTVLDAAR